MSSSASAAVAASGDSYKRYMDACYVAVMCLISFTSYTTLAFVNPLAPDEFLKVGIPQYFVGTVFSLSPLAVLLFSPMMNSYTKQHGRMKVANLCLWLQIVGCLAFAY